MATKAKAAAKKTTKRAPRAAQSEARGVDQLYRAAKAHKAAKTVPAEQLPAEFSRADIEFIGVDHSGASYEARVFINNPNADEHTPTTEANGYAGSFNIFGHGKCFGDIGHCDVQTAQDEFDPRPTHPLVPIKKVVIATDAIRQAVGQGGDISVTVIPVVKSWTEQSDLDDVLKFDHINLVTYD